MRIALGIEYNGARYSGWQQQTHTESIQGVLQQAISKVANQAIEIHCAGRTDRGVHATAQVVHFDTEAMRSEYGWICGTNSALPYDIRVRWAKAVDNTFHARFSALARRYQYYIYNAPIRSGLFCLNLAWEFCPLDQSRMHNAAQYLLGTHDFSAFRAAGCQSKSSIRTVYFCSVERHSPSIIKLDIEANAFLYHMVRNIAGALINIGKGLHQSDWVAQLLEEKNRKKAAMTAPPEGLYLVHVRYPEQYSLPLSIQTPVLL